MSYSSELKAKDLGAWSSKGNYRRLWGYSKRELIELAIHLAAQTTDSYELALETEQALRIVLEEVVALRKNKLI